MDRQVSSQALATQKLHSKKVPELPAEKDIEKLTDPVKDVEEKSWMLLRKIPQ